MEVFISVFKHEGGKVRGKSSEMSIILSVTNPVEGLPVEGRGVLLMMSIVRKFNKGDLY